MGPDFMTFVQEHRKLTILLTIAASTVAKAASLQASPARCLWVDSAQQRVVPSSSLWLRLAAMVKSFVLKTLPSL